MTMRCRNIADFRAAARRRLPRPIFDYLDGGAEDEVSLRAAAEDIDRIRIVPRVLNDVSTIRRSVRLFGRPIAAPLMISPTGLSGLYHPQGECAVARAAAAAGLPYCLSTLGSTTIEAVAASTSAPKLLQLYIFRDRGITIELIERARAAGYDGLVVTLDTPVGGRRERDLRNGMTMPPRPTARSMLSFAMHPRWSLPALVQPQRFRFGNLQAAIGGDDDGPSVSAFVNRQFDRSLGWMDLEWLVERWEGSVAVKGVLDPGDALRAIQAGADTIIVSNHGGRQLDGAASAISRIAAVADAVAGKAAIVCDGGIRRGVHIAKALALGATACSIGRPYLYGLAAGGERGVTEVLAAFIEELDRCMALMGIADVAGLNRSLLDRWG